MASAGCRAGGKTLMGSFDDGDDVVQACQYWAIQLNYQFCTIQGHIIANNPNKLSRPNNAPHPILTGTHTMIISQSLILLFALTFALPVQAEIYKWTDADGEAHFSGSKPADPASIESITYLDNKAPESDPTGTGDQAAPQVDIYITSWCPYCKKAMAFLRQNNIAFNAYDIEQDIDAATRKKTLDPGYKCIPLAVVNGTTIRGFSDAAYQQALAK
jgi:glutaredoxin